MTLIHRDKERYRDRYHTIQGTLEMALGLGQCDMCDTRRPSVWFEAEGLRMCEPDARELGLLEGLTVVDCDCQREVV
jgi:hypothetical protein